MQKNCSNTVRYCNVDFDVQLTKSLAKTVHLINLVTQSLNQRPRRPKSRFIRRLGSKGRLAVRTIHVIETFIEKP